MMRRPIAAAATLRPMKRIHSPDESEAPIGRSPRYGRSQSTDGHLPSPDAQDGDDLRAAFDMADAVSEISDDDPELPHTD
jgi:hypothetical protein